MKKPDYNPTDVMQPLTPRQAELLAASPKMTDFYDAKYPETYEASWELWYTANCDYWRNIDQSTPPTLPPQPPLTPPQRKKSTLRAFFGLYLAGQGRAVLICLIIFELLLIILKGL